MSSSWPCPVDHVLGPSFPPSEIAQDSFLLWRGSLSWRLKDYKKKPNLVFHTSCVTFTLHSSSLQWQHNIHLTVLGKRREVLQIPTAAFSARLTASVTLIYLPSSYSNCILMSLPRNSPFSGHKEHVSKASQILFCLSFSSLEYLLNLSYTSILISVLIRIHEPVCFFLDGHSQLPHTE